MTGDPEGTSGWPDAGHRVPDLTAVAPHAGAAQTHRYRLALWAFAGCGLAVAIVLLVRAGLPQILELLRTAGYALIVLVPLHLVPLALDASGWRALLPPGGPGRSYLTGAAVIRESVGGLLPVRVGGEIAGIRLLLRRGVPGVAATASVVVEVTLWLVAQLIFAVAGLVLLVLLAHGDRNPAPRWAAGGLLLTAVGLAAFVVLQRRVGLFTIVEHILAGLAGRDVVRRVADPARLDAAIRRLYRDRGALSRCVAWQLTGFVAGAAETWVAFQLIRQPVSVPAAVVMESLTVALQSATFFVPAGLGTQEAGFVLLGAAVGVSTPAALAGALARRGRQLALGVPALLAWFWLERRPG